MPFLSDRTIRSIGELIIHPFRPERVGTGAYELSLHRDSRASGDGHTRDERFLEIPPGQFAYLFTEERVTLRTDLLGFISIKSSLKWQGLINISGFHVDPGYKGQLKFAVYNAGGRTVCLEFGAPTFQLWIASFDQPATAYKKPGCTGITGDDLSELREDIASPSSLDRRIGEFEKMPSPRDLERRIHPLELKPDAVVLEQRISRIEVANRTIVGVLGALGVFATIGAFVVGMVSCHNSGASSSQAPTSVSVISGYGSVSSLGQPGPSVKPSILPSVSPTPNPQSSVPPATSPSPTPSPSEERSTPWPKSTGTQSHSPSESNPAVNNASKTP